MKKYLLLTFLFTSSIIYAQVPEDAIRYSFYPQSGTARNMAVGRSEERRVGKECA